MRCTGTVSAACAVTTVDPLTWPPSPSPSLIALTFHVPVASLYEYDDYFRALMITDCEALPPLHFTQHRRAHVEANVGTPGHGPVYLRNLSQHRLSGTVERITSEMQAIPNDQDAGRIAMITSMRAF
jgi:hypothetical protein